jgi:pimeloyl-ACP methyl ester carboxylesterase
MPEHDITEPVPFTEAFAREDPDAVHSRAAALLLLGAQMEEEPVAFSVRAGVRGTVGPGDMAPPEDVEPLRVPVMEPTGERMTRERVRGYLAEQMAMAPEEIAEPGPERIAELAARVEERPTVPMAAAMFEASLQDPHELVRVAAAIAYLEAAADPLEMMPPLVEGTWSNDPTVRDLAATGLARFAPEHPRLAEMREPAPGGAEGEPAHTALLVHGTFARDGRWWRPGGDFHTYLLQNVRPDLYAAADRFDWSGGYSDAARALGARDLAAWVRQRDLEGLDLVTHSHGGSSAMLASQQGLDLGQLVLLSCPVHARKYFPDFGRVREVVSIRVRLDLVILADRGGQRFRDPRIREIVLPIWFRHSDTHEPDVWQRHNVPALL